MAGEGGGYPAARRNAHSQHPCGTQLEEPGATGRLQGTGPKLLHPCKALHEEV